MSAPSHRLFFALRPAPPAALAMERVAAELKAARIVRGHWLKSAKYHITLHFLGDHVDVPPELIECAHAAGDAVRHAPFDIELDRIGSFRGRGQSPCVALCTPESQSVVRRFRDAISRAMIGHNLRMYVERNFTPHLTLAYGDRALAQAIAIEPVRWTARDFVLIHSHAGVHDALARWLLL